APCTLHLAPCTLNPMFSRRRNNGISILFLLLGACGLISACTAVFLGVPLSIYRSVDVSSLPQPTAEELPSLPNGTDLIITGQLPLSLPESTQGLAVYYLETRPLVRSTDSGEMVSSSDSFERDALNQTEIPFLLSNGREVTVRLPQDVIFSNAERIKTDPVDNIEQQYVGFGRGQTIALEGRWEGNDRLTAATLHAGTAEDFVSGVQSAPGMLFVYSLLCGGLSLAILVVGGILRFLGR
ncbi:MAG: hypothetical protein KDD89_02050, partial [Anaerolineales bacterium]|nr:hypothetical protein [Anaerolineales bacterium]